jgi:hypothetical protein
MAILESGMSEAQDLEKRGMGVLRAAEADAGETFLRYEAYEVLDRYMGWLSRQAESSGDADQVHWHLWRRLAALPTFRLRECWNLPVDCPWFPSQTDHVSKDRKFLVPTARPQLELNGVWYDAAHRNLGDMRLSNWTGALSDDVQRFLMYGRPPHAFLLSWQCSFVPAFSWGAQCEFEMWGASRGFPLWPSVLTSEGLDLFLFHEDFSFPENDFPSDWFSGEGREAAEPRALSKLLMGP